MENRYDKNEMILEVQSRSCNEGLVRIAVAAFSTQLNPTLEEVADIKTAVSEAITNCIVHAYEKETEVIRVECRNEKRQLTVVVKDKGKGIQDVKKAMEPLFTTKPEQDRSGMGFAFMEAFMDKVEVDSQPGQGTTVTMKKLIGRQNPVFE
ncbi:MAG TPA: anti-sigma F factor [Candidatus Blautia pullicola]|jgi:stage II sporulation protein AB (anti-sigma F factor)|uniref:Anti-sigma F factor n=1 Tax=Candidatus Blautia pullicola TaxID=2838498 RepID=A0A9D2FRF0_9FIRM|nr:anti-sigma F factor [Candidatus Blautia pullicola]